MPEIQSTKVPEIRWYRGPPYSAHSDRISLFLFQSTTLTPPGPPWVSKEAKLSTEFKIGGLVRYRIKFKKSQKSQINIKK